MIESWLELRHALERVTNADRMRDQQIRPLLKNPPEITYMIPPRVPIDRGGLRRIGVPQERRRSLSNLVFSARAALQ
jgi:hypothetical protein